MSVYVLQPCARCRSWSSAPRSSRAADNFASSENWLYNARKEKRLRGADATATRCLMATSTASYLPKLTVQLNDRGAEPIRQWEHHALPSGVTIVADTFPVAIFIA